MKWELLLAGPATKALKRMPAADRRRVLAVLDASAAHRAPYGEACRLAPPRRRLANSLRRRAGTTPRARSRHRQADIDHLLTSRGQTCRRVVFAN